MKKILPLVLIVALFSCQKEVSVNTDSSKLPVHITPSLEIIQKAPEFDLTKMIKLTSEEISEGKEFALRSPYALKDVDWYLENTFSNFAAGNWTVNLPGGKKNTNYGWWYQAREQFDWLDSNVILLHHVYPTHPELNGDLAIALFRDDYTDTDGNYVGNGSEGTIQTGNWEIIAIGSSGIYSRYTRGGGRFTYTYAEQIPTCWYADGTPINPTRRTVTLTGRIRY